jgi:hypothetical protein
MLGSTLICAIAVFTVASLAYGTTWVDRNASLGTSAIGNSVWPPFGHPILPRGIVPAHASKRHVRVHRHVSPQATTSPGTTSTNPTTPGGFPSAANTGYQNAPGYPGQLTGCGTNLRAGATYQYCDFPDGLDVNRPNVTFIGCRFASNSVLDADVQVDANNITFSYDTFEPSAVSAPPVPYGSGYQYGINQTGPFQMTVEASNFWGFGEAVQLTDPDGSSQSNPLVIKDSYIHDPSAQGPDGPNQYHVDGILSNNGGASYMTITHNTISAPADTNALALQTSGGGSSGTPYSHITVTDNYFSGFGYMVNTGDDTNSIDMVFTGNVWGTNFEPGWGPLYGNAMYTNPGLGGIWRDNTIDVVPGTSWMAPGNNGLFWWPTDANPSSPGQIIGHKSDYPGP